MTRHATGSFSVSLVPQDGGGSAIGRFVIEKQFYGTLAASSRGEMLAFRTSTEGSAGYVAMELVTGTVAGRRGTFVLQHSGTMNRGAAGLGVTVVPDSGTDQLAGLMGSMRILEGGAHAYEFEYDLPDDA